MCTIKSAGMVVAAAFAAALPALGGAARAQESPFRDSVFDAELMKILVQQSQRGGAAELPSLDVTIRYSRHRPFDDHPIYERGPYDLTQQIFRSTYSYNLTLNTIGAKAAQNTGRSGAYFSPGNTPAALQAEGLAERAITIAPQAVVWYAGAMVVRGTEVGDLPDVQSAGGDYLIRVALLPARYANDTLWATALLQRAAMPTEQPSAPPKDISTVYKKSVYLLPHEPLTLELPPRAEHDETVEAVTVALETPQGFGLSRSVPDPVVNRAMFAYALPVQCAVKLTVSKPDGTAVDTLAHCVEEAGVYRSVWDSRNQPPGTFFCTLEAAPRIHGAPYFKQVSVVKIAAPNEPLSRVPGSQDSLIEEFPVATIPLEEQRIDHVFRVLVEGGAAYTEPQNPQSPFDNMFAHVAVGLGFTLTNTIEVGVAFGQDGFHKQREQLNPYIVPASDQAVESYTVPWVGGYGRVYFARGGMRGFFHASFAAANGGLVTEFGIGVIVPISSGLSVYLMPQRTDQWDVHPSTKWGANYGLEFYF